MESGIIWIIIAAVFTILGSSSKKKKRANTAPTEESETNFPPPVAGNIPPIMQEVKRVPPSMNTKGVPPVKSAYQPLEQRSEKKAKKANKKAQTSIDFHNDEQIEAPSVERKKSNFDLRAAVIYSEVLQPKFKDYN